MLLPFLLKPYVDESARGYIVRLAEEHGVSSNQMCEWLQLPTGSKPLTGSAAHACRIDAS